MSVGFSITNPSLVHGMSLQELRCALLLEDPEDPEQPRRFGTLVSAGGVHVQPGTAHIQHTTHLVDVRPSLDELVAQTLFVVRC
jgi:hypothetical protein